MVARRTLARAVLLALGFAAEASQAWGATQADARGKALAWMVQQQNGDGGWVDVARTGQAIPTAVFVDSLSSSGIRHGYVSGAATNWLLNDEPDTVEGLARQITALARTGVDTAIPVARLMKARSKGRAGANLWGTYADWSPSMPETALALEALMVSGHPAASTLQAQIKSLQKGDGGWAYGEQSASRSAVLPTAEAVRVLSAYALQNPSAKPAADAAVNNGVNWLLARVKSDGGFADDANSTGSFTAANPSQPLETAQAWSALHLAASAGYSAAQSAAAINALNSSQSRLLAKQAADGSWGGDPLVTAMVLHAWGTTTLASNTLADADRDGLPDMAEPALGTSPTVATDARNLIKPNRNGMAAATPDDEGDVPILPGWGMTLLGCTLLAAIWRRRHV